MIYFENTALQSACLHLVGNKGRGEGILLSVSPMQVDNSIRPILLQFFISPFKSAERYSFFHHSGLEFNFVCKIVRGVFNNPESLYDSSVMLANQLYDCSENNRIKGGEFYVAYFKEVEVDGIITDAVGLFKTENKETYLHVVSRDGKNDMEQEAGININKLDKGCIVFNMNQEEGYSLAIIDNTNKTEAKYWIEDFLQARPRSDEFHQTQTVLQAAKKYITKQLPVEREITKGEQAELLNKSLRFFQENECFEISRFSNVVMGDNSHALSFEQFAESYSASSSLELVDGFNISASAVKKYSRSTKSVIKLDRNFHIYIHGGEGLIKRGYDEASGMEFYQLFFEKEE